MPGFEVINAREKQALSKLFNEGGVLIAHGFENKRKKFHVREFEQNCSTRNKSVIAVSGSKCA